MTKYQLTWVADQEVWTFDREHVVCGHLGQKLLGWPLKSIKVKVDEEPFPGSHEIEIEEDLLDDYVDIFPIIVDGEDVQDHYRCVSEIAGMTHFYVGLA